MKKHIVRDLALALALVAAASGTSAADERCPVYASSSGARAREYDSCADCLEHHERCEERCGSESGYVCMAQGYGRSNALVFVRGDVERSEARAERDALGLCREQGLQDCTISECSQRGGSGREEVRPCEGRPGWNPVRPDDDDERRDRRRRREPEPSIPQPVPPPANPKCVVSWQHVKEQCMSRPYEKILKQCPPNINFWHGIYCKVTWGDSRTEDVHGRVDLTDACGHPYCTRDSRPANFNCVPQCDNSPGPLMTVPR